MTKENSLEITPYADGFLDLDGLHQMYWQQSGNPQGVPVVVLHGGPGAGLNPKHRRYFDPDFYRIIAYDQRGAGRSLPSGELRNNTAFDLVEDLEALRKFLKIERWIVTGSSWGSTLTLLYAQTYPEACLALVPRSIYLGTPDEKDWQSEGLPYLFPDAFEKLGDQTLEQASAGILSDKKAVSEKAMHDTYRFYTKIGRIVSEEYEESADFPASLARIEAAYHQNNLFLKDCSILENMEKISPIPGVILHGRYDMICPVISAFQLAKAWPKSKLVIIPDAGHSNSEGQFPEKMTKVFEGLKQNFIP